MISGKKFLRVSLRCQPPLSDEAHPNIPKDVIYTVDGRCVQQDRVQLPQGIYIINGKKVFIK